jgi:hypothetical protein
MSVWATRSPANAAVLAEFLSCDRSGPELTRQACLARAATGQLAQELADVTTAPALASQALPAPLRWFLG